MKIHRVEIDCGNEIAYKELPVKKIHGVKYIQESEVIKLEKEFIEMLYALNSDVRRLNEELTKSKGLCDLLEIGREQDFKKNPLTVSEHIKMYAEKYNMQEEEISLLRSQKKKLLEALMILTKEQE